MRGMKDYISDQNREIIESAIHTLKEELDFDAAAISQLHFAIYLFQESVSIYLFVYFFFTYNFLHAKFRWWQ